MRQGQTFPARFCLPALTILANIKMEKEVKGQNKN